MKKVLFGFMITWKITGYTMQQCDPKQADPVSGMCVNPVEYVRTQLIDEEKQAISFAKELKKAERPYKVSDVHIYKGMVDEK